MTSVDLVSSLVTVPFGVDQVEESFHTFIGGCDQPHSDDVTRKPDRAGLGGHD